MGKSGYHKSAFHARMFCAMLAFVLLNTAAAAGVVIGGATEAGAREVTFSIRPPREVSTVHLAGDFNSWSMSADPMSDEDGDGVYEATIAIEPGNYEYKFVLDDEEWISDPDNPGDPEVNFGNSQLVVDEVEVRADGLVPFTVVYESPGAEQVELFWGLNGWTDRLGELIPGIAAEGERHTTMPMGRDGEGRHWAELMVPADASLIFVLHGLEPNEFWDNNGEQDYTVDIKPGGSVTISGDGEIQEVSRGIFGTGSERLALPLRDYFSIFGMLSMLAASLVLSIHYVRRGDETRRTLRYAGAVWLAAGALCMRLALVPVAGWEIDEMDYVPITHEFVWAMDEGRFAGMSEFPHVTEHPRLAMTLYALVHRAIGGRNHLDAVRTTARSVAAIFAAATVFILALRFPLAAMLWALCSPVIKYTSIAYLDSPMTFFCTACVLSFDHAARLLEESDAERPGWFAARVLPWWLVSAVCAGCAVSTKYLAAPAPMAVGFWMLWRIARGGKIARLSSLKMLGTYVALSLVVMVATDVHLWAPDPISRIAGRLSFHQQFSQNDIVQNAAFPWYQPVVHVWTFVNWAEVGWPWLDRLIAIVGFPGLVYLWWKNPRLGLTGVLFWVFLLVWPTKWPQYIVAALPWVAVSTEMVLVHGTAEGWRAWKDRQPAEEVS